MKIINKDQLWDKLVDEFIEEYILSSEYRLSHTIAIEILRKYGFDHLDPKLINKLIFDGNHKHLFK